MGQITIEIKYDNKLVQPDVFAKFLFPYILKLWFEHQRLSKDVISQREAYKTYGKGNVMRWKKNGELIPLSIRTGKIEYKVTDLEKLRNRFQDYF